MTAQWRSRGEHTQIRVTHEGEARIERFECGGWFPFAKRRGGRTVAIDRRFELPANARRCAEVKLARLVEGARR